MAVKPIRDNRKTCRKESRHFNESLDYDSFERECHRIKAILSKFTKDIEDDMHSDLMNHGSEVNEYDKIPWELSDKIYNELFDINEICTDTLRYMELRYGR